MLSIMKERTDLSCVKPSRSSESPAPEEENLMVHDDTEKRAHQLLNDYFLSFLLMKVIF